jgi:signal transduction histidine kinase
MINIRFLNDLTEIFQKSMNADETYPAVFEILNKTVAYDSATLFIYNSVNDRLEKVYQKGGVVVDLIPEIPFDRGSGISSWMSHQQDPVVLASLQKSRPGKEAKFNSFLSLPLWANGMMIGVLNMAHNTSNYFTYDNLELYRTLGSQISKVLNSLFLQRELDQKNRQLSHTIEQLKKAQAELVEKERLAAIGEIVVTVNHEINNPLTSIIGLTEILKLSCPSASIEKIREALNGILQEAKRIQRVTRKLRDLKSSESEVYVGNQRMTKLSD